MNHGVDKEALYGRYQRREDKDGKYQDGKRELALRLAHKATDTPYRTPEDMIIDAKKVIHQRGVGALGAAGIALAAGLPSALVAGYLMLRGPADKPAAAADTRPVATQPVTTALAAPQAAQKDSEWDSELYEIDTGKVLDRVRYRSRSGVVEQKLPDGTWKPAPNVKAPQ